MSLFVRVIIASLFISQLAPAIPAASRKKVKVTVWRAQLSCVQLMLPNKKFITVHKDLLPAQELVPRRTVLLVDLSKLPDGCGKPAAGE